MVPALDVCSRKSIIYNIALLSGLFLEKAGHTSYNKAEFKKINPLITGG